METPYVNVAEEFLKSFKAPEDFKVPDEFVIARKKSILLKREEAKEMQTFSKAGIIIPGQSTANKYVGRIYAVGPEVTDLRPGMLVIFNAFADQIIMLKGEPFITMSELDVFYILPEGAGTLEANPENEKRRQYSIDEMPSNEVTKEEIQERREKAAEGAELLKKDATKIIHGPK